MSRVRWEMTVQFFWWTFGVQGVRSVSFKIAAQQNRLPPQPVDSENEVKGRSDQWHEPDKANPGNGGTGISLIKDYVSGGDNREQQVQSGQCNMPNVVHDRP